MHLSGVKPFTIERKKKNADGGYDFIKKKICMNTVAQKVESEEEGMAYMAHYLETHKGHKVTKYYFSNIR